MEPLHTRAGVTTADAATLRFRMITSQVDAVWAYQIDLLLPDGVQLDETLPSPFTLTADHHPLTADETGYQHHVDYAHLATGWWRIIVTPDDSTRLTANDGIVLDARFVTANTLADGIYPVRVRGSVISTTGSAGTEPMFSTSFLTVGTSPLSVSPAPSLQAFTGYLPTFVVDSLNRSLSANTRLTSLDLRNADSLALPLQVQNANALVLAKSGTAHAAVTNTVAIDHLGAATCSHLQLHESWGPFAAPLPFSVDSGTIYRPMVSYKWNTLCLPFAMTTDQVAAVFGSTSHIARFSGLSEDALGHDMLCFTPIDITAEGIEANVPYLIRPESSLLRVPLHGMQMASTTALEQEADDFVFVGSYDAGAVIPDGYYYISDNRFWLSRGLSTQLAFRGIFRDDRPSPSRISSMAFRFDEDDNDDENGVVTAIDGVPVMVTTDAPLYNLQGQRVTHPRHGIYLRGGRKTVVH